MITKYFFKKLLIEQYSIVERKKCLRHRKSSHSCSLCIDRCPREAISLREGLPRIDESLCQGCGICRRGCPSGAILTKGFGEKKTLQQMGKKEVLILGCDDEKSSKTISYPCLQGLTAEYFALMLLLYPKREFFLNLIHCGDCKMSMNQGEKKDLQGVEEDLQKAEELVKNVGITPRITLVYSEENLPEETEERMTRRDLFQQMKTGSLAVGFEMAGTALGDDEEDENDDAGLREVLIQRLLNQNEDRLMANEEQVQRKTDFFTAWNVSGDCDGCGICQSICPTQSWNLKKEQEGMRLIHDGAKCRGCNLCKESCPKKAMEKEDFLLEDLREARTIREWMTVPCSGCRQRKVIKMDGKGRPPICPSCEKRESLRRSLS